MLTRLAEELEPQRHDRRAQQIPDSQRCWREGGDELKTLFTETLRPGIADRLREDDALFGLQLEQSRQLAAIQFVDNRGQAF